MALREGIGKWLEGIRVLSMQKKEMQMNRGGAKVAAKGIRETQSRLMTRGSVN